MEYFLSHALTPETVCEYIDQTGCTAIFIRKLDGAFKSNTAICSRTAWRATGSCTALSRMSGMTFVPVPEGGQDRMTKLKRLMHGALASEKRLIALCYALFFAASVLVCLASFAEDAFQRAGGQCGARAAGCERLCPHRHAAGTARCFHLYFAGPAHGAGAFARLCAHRDGGLHLQQRPGRILHFYKTSPQQTEYDATRRAWGYRQADGTYSFTLPKGPHLWPAAGPWHFTNLTFEVNSITINAPRSFFSWFAPTPVWVLGQAVVPL